MCPYALQIDALKYNFEKEFLSYLTQPQDAMQIATVRQKDLCLRGAIKGYTSLLHNKIE